MPETTPGVTADGATQGGARRSCSTACDGFLRPRGDRRVAHSDERREILRGMVLTRAVDNRLKQFFTSGEVQLRRRAVSGKGLPLARPGGDLRGGDPAAARGRRGAIASADGRATSSARSSATSASRSPCVPSRRPSAWCSTRRWPRSGPPMDGKDLHIGDLEWGILPATAPLSISTLSIAGMAMAFAREGQQRVARVVHRRGRLLARRMARGDQPLRRRRLPAVFCIENNQTRSRRRCPTQSAVRVFADKARGYGIPGITIDGTDPDAIAAAFTWAAERARAGARSGAHRARVACACAATRTTTTCCISARSRAPAWDYPPLSPGAYADRDAYVRSGRSKDPIASYAARLEAAGVIAPATSSASSRRRATLVETEARAVIDAPWPEPEEAGSRRLRRATSTARASRAARAGHPPCRSISIPALPELDDQGCPSIKQGPHVPRRDRAGHRRRAARRSARVRLRRGRRRPVRQRVPAAAAAARRVRRSHHQLTARRERRARRVRRRGAGRPAADRRDAVQRLRRQRLQSAREQRGQDSLPVGRLGADGRPDAVGRPAPRRAVSLAEHRSRGSIARPG